MANTTQRLKGDIDAGKTGDKIPQGFDPGLATLGTDDEAAGTPNTPHQVAMARELEQRNAPAQPLEQGADTRRPGRPATWIIVAVGVVVLLVLGAALLGGRL